MQIRQNTKENTFGVRWKAGNRVFQKDTWYGGGAGFLHGKYYRFSAPNSYHKDTLLYPEELDQWT